VAKPKAPPQPKFEVPVEDADRAWMIRQCGGLIVAAPNAPSIANQDWRIQKVGGSGPSKSSVSPEERFEVPEKAADKRWMIRQCGGLIVPGPGAPPEERFKVPGTREDREWMIRRCLTQAARKNLYEVIVPLFDKATRERFGLRLTLPYYPQDPLVASKADYAELLPENQLRARAPVSVGWEPGLTHGPTSARLAVVDYDGDTGTLDEPARWDPMQWAFTDPDGTPIPPAAPHSCYFRQVNLWFTVQSIVEYFEDPWGLGRPLPWAFRGNRLILVPHAGWGTNAFYDRRSKSLQFYVYGSPDEPRYTCLSHDIIAHETGHAVLDGIRPLYLEHSSPQTAAFHEFVADLTAVLTALRNNVARAVLARMREKDTDPLKGSNFVTELAGEFGRYLYGRDYLRSAMSKLKMADLRLGDSPHHCSQVLTGAMYDILHRIALKNLETQESYSKALWWAAERVRRIAIQALDYCPPADIQFTDYARAVLRCYGLASRRDSKGYGELMREVFHERGLCTRPWQECSEKEGCQLEPEAPPSRNELLLRHDFDIFSASSTGAYYFLHDNRGRLGIPASEDVEVVGLYRTSKWGVGRERLPRELVLEYVWRAPVALDLPRHGSLRGHQASLLCGGTLVFDEYGNPISWSHKGRYDDWGDPRGELLRDHVAALVESGAVALVGGREAALSMGPPVVARLTAGGLSFEAAPHLRNRGSDVEDVAVDSGKQRETLEDRYGAEPWSTSF